MLQIVLTLIFYAWLFATLVLLWAIYRTGSKQTEELQNGLIAAVFKKAESAHIAAEAAQMAAEAARTLAHAQPQPFVTTVTLEESNVDDITLPPE